MLTWYARSKTHTYHCGIYQSILASGALHELASEPYLIKKCANLELRDGHGRTPLLFALEQSIFKGLLCREAVKLPFDNGADVKTVDDEGKTCLSRAGDDLVLIK